jgi:hypothetical protein
MAASASWCLQGGMCLFGRGGISRARTRGNKPDQSAQALVHALCLHCGARCSIECTASTCRVETQNVSSRDCCINSNNTGLAQHSTAHLCRSISAAVLKVPSRPRGACFNSSSSRLRRSSSGSPCEYNKGTAAAPTHRTHYMGTHTDCCKLPYTSTHTCWMPATPLLVGSESQHPPQNHTSACCGQ